MQEGAKAYEGILESDQAASTDLDDTGAFKLRKEAVDASSNWLTRREFFVQASSAAKDALSAEPNDRGRADFALINAMGKLIDPNSVVRNEEGKMIVEAGSDALNAFIFQAQRWFGKTGILEPRARRNLLKQIDTLYQAETEQQRGRVAQFKNEINNLGVLPQEYLELVVPDSIDPDSPFLPNAQIDFEAWSADEKAFDLERAFEETRVGGTFTAPDGTVYRKGSDDPNHPNAVMEVRN